MRRLVSIVHRVALLVVLVFMASVRSSATSDTSANGEQAFQYVYSTPVVVAHTPTGDLQLLLDTGSQELRLTPEALRRLRLSTHSVRIAGNEAEQGILRELHIGAVTRRQVPFYPIPSDLLYYKLDRQVNSHVPIDGLLGISCLHDLTVGVDMLRNRIFFQRFCPSLLSLKGEFFASQKGGYKLESLHCIPFKLTQNQMLFDVNIGNVTTCFALDTGATISVADSRLTACLPSVSSPISVSVALPDKSFENVSTNMFVARDIGIGAEKLPYGWFVNVDLPKFLPTCGLLGIDLFRRTCLLIDFPSRKLWVARYASPERDLQKRLLKIGIAPIYTPTGWCGYPYVALSEANGLQSGVYITTINHHSLDLLTDAELASNSMVLGLKVQRSQDDGVRDVKVPLKPGQYVPDLSSTVAVRLLPDVPVIYWLPDGGTYIPRGYKDPTVKRTGRALVRVPTGGMLIADAGSQSPASRIVPVRESQLPKLSYTFYPADPDAPIRLEPGSYWVEQPLNHSTKAFSVMSSPLGQNSSK